jgi:ornithine carbamoyltransferase
MVKQKNKGIEMKINESIKDFLTLKDFQKGQIKYMLDLASRIKKRPGYYRKVLSGKNIALLFEKHSTRTRLSFEAGINQLGGNVIYLESKSLQVSRGETYEDTGKIFSCYLDGLVIRTFSQEMVEKLAANSRIPVINGLTDSYHPCQILSDLFTLDQMGILNNRLKFTYIGDSNNVCNSLIIGLSKMGIVITIGSPRGYQPSDEIIDYAASLLPKGVIIESDPLKAVKDADIIYTDVWVSMGDEKSSEKYNAMKNYQVNRDLIKNAAKDVKIMHCLPAHRGEEITAEVIEGKNSIVFEQAENRLYAQKALLVYLYS